MILLIARKHGSSSSRRQRKFRDMDAVDRAIIRWRKDGYTVWWIYKEADELLLINHWQDEPHD